MALIEWFFWLMAFNFCLIQVMKKATNWSTRILAFVMMLIFSAFRLVTVS
jgi:chitin synthase